MKDLTRAALTMLVGLFICCGAVCTGTAGDLQDFPTCQYCNMNRQAYAHSRMLVVYEDGPAFGSCSIHCAALNMVIRIHDTPELIWVADYFSGELVNAEEASWVLGGDKPGVMTKRAKWAFGRKVDAERFISEHGGQKVTFEDVLRATYQDMYDDSRMIRIKKNIRRMSPY